MAYFLLQERPDGQWAWEDNEGRSYNFPQRLPNAKNLCKNDTVLFYRPVKSGTDEDGCVFATAVVASVTVGDHGLVDASPREYVVFGRPLRLGDVSDPRRNPQHSFQPLPRTFFLGVLGASGSNEGATH